MVECHNTDIPLLDGLLQQHIQLKFILMSISEYMLKSYLSNVFPQLTKWGWGWSCKICCMLGNTSNVTLREQCHPLADSERIAHHTLRHLYNVIHGLMLYNCYCNAFSFVIYFFMSIGHNCTYYVKN